jgi:8-oxo-dGTP diphosphatase
MNADLAQSYRNKTRVRVVGILIESNKLLLVNHRGLTSNHIFWNPPGGAVLVGESSASALAREFLEETGLIVQIERFLFVNEVITNNLHAIELFFQVSRTSGSLITGTDPEHGSKNQLIQNVAFLSSEEIKNLPNEAKHNALHNLQRIDNLLNSDVFTTFNG